LWFATGGVVAALLLGWATWQRKKSARAFGNAAIVQHLAQSVRPGVRIARGVLVVLAVTLIGVALAGPRLGTNVQEIQREGVDLVIALDVSQSMLAEDVAPNRLERAKNEIKSLIDELSGDRVGLVLFAGDGFVQCPLTTDYDAVRLFLDVAEPSLIPTPGTDFDAAFRAAAQAFDRPASDSTRQQPRSNALLIVSDGENHMGDIDELRADAKEQRLIVFTAGVGERDGAPVPEIQNGQRMGVKRGPDGNVVRSRLDEAALTNLAESGAYFRIARTSSALTDLTSALNRLEKSSFGVEQFEDYDEYFQWPLALALLLLAAELAITTRRSSARPRSRDSNKSADEPFGNESAAANASSGDGASTEPERVPPST
jgi:Ca-activated chloride channel family protein